jgi:hypothetical protein
MAGAKSGDGRIAMRYPLSGGVGNVLAMISPSSLPAAPRRSSCRLRTTVRLEALLAVTTLVLLAPDATSAVKRRAFVTSAAGTGDLASWAGSSGATALERADSICRYHAAGGQLPNWETYRAWISGPGTDAYCHVQGLSGTRISGCNAAPLPGGGPWYLANGITPWSGTLDQVTGLEAQLYRPIALDENLDEISNIWDERFLWTGSDREGRGYSGLDCNDWTSDEDVPLGAGGDALGVGGRFTYAFPPQCSAPAHLLCLEPGESETVLPRWSAGALVFATSVEGTGDLGSWPQADGLAGIHAAFRVCRNLATAAHLPAPASFVPWLSTTLVDAVDRLTTNGPFRRPDGLMVANDVAELVGISFPRNSIHQVEDGRYIGGPTDHVWTGTFADGTDGGFTCDNWTNEVSGHGRAGFANIGRAEEWTDANAYLCQTDARLYCFSNVITLFWDGFESGTTARWSATAP